MTTLALSPVTIRRSAVNPWFVAAAVVIPTFMEILDTTVANVALRYMAGGLSAPVTDSKWIITSYLAANAIVLPITGWLSARLGRRNYFLLSIAARRSTARVPNVERPPVQRRMTESPCDRRGNQRARPVGCKFDGPHAVQGGHGSKLRVQQRWLGAECPSPRSVPAWPELWSGATRQRGSSAGAIRRGTSGSELGQCQRQEKPAAARRCVPSAAYDCRAIDAGGKSCKNGPKCPQCDRDGGG